MRGPSNSVDLAKALGRQVRRHRDAIGLLQDDIAAAGRMLGLPRWTRATVAATESGSRRLSVPEFLMLPDIFELASNAHGKKRSFELSDFVPEELNWIELTPQAVIRPAGLRAKLQGQAAKLGEAERLTRRDAFELLTKALGSAADKDREIERVFPGLSPAERAKAIVDSHGAAESKAALSLAALGIHTSAHLVAAAALLLWGRSFSEQRDLLLSKRTPSSTNARTLQAIRGRIARDLIEDELRPFIEHPPWSARRKPTKDSEKRRRTKPSRRKTG